MTNKEIHNKLMSISIAIAANDDLEAQKAVMELISHFKSDYEFEKNVSKVYDPDKEWPDFVDGAPI